MYKGQPSPANKGKYSTPEKPRAVNYFRHFPINFLKPYAAADPVPDERKVFTRTH